jgi:Holliday junction resolvase RusA-like endonuclease
MPQCCYNYTIGGKPITKKNSQQILINKATGRPFVAPSRQFQAYALTASYFLRPKPPEPIDYPVQVRCLFYMPTRQRVDKTNLEESIHDILVKYGVLADDSRDIIASTDGSRVLYDKTKPRVEIAITPLAEDYDQWRKK